jgi:hypothetical protein
VQKTRFFHEKHHSLRDECSSSVENFLQSSIGDLSPWKKLFRLENEIFYLCIQLLNLGLFYYSLLITHRNFLQKQFESDIDILFILKFLNHYQQSTFKGGFFMAIDVSKQVAGLLAVTREVVSSTENHGPLIVDPLKTELGNYTSTEGFDPSVFITILKAYLNSKASALRDADIALAQERADDPQFRDKRDSAIASANKVVTKVKSVLNESALIAFGLSSKTPDAPDAVINYIRKIIALLKVKPEAVNTESGDEDEFVTVNVETMINSLTKCADNIELALSDVKREERELQAAIDFRDLKLKEWKDAYIPVASILSGLYQLGGKSDLADRIRPTVRKSSGGEVVEPEPDVAPADNKTE